MDEDLLIDQSELLPAWVIIIIAVFLLAFVGGYIFLYFQKRKFKRANDELSRLPGEWVNLMHNKDISGRLINNGSVLQKKHLTKKS